MGLTGEGGLVTLALRFWEKVNKKGPRKRGMTSRCWLWTASTRNEHGYGAIVVDGKPRLAHRVAWELVHGPIPDGKKVLHKCDTPACVRHLFLGTQKDNVADCARKNRRRFARGEHSGRYTHPEATARGEQHGNSKLTTEKVLRLRALRAGGTKQRALSALFGISLFTVRSIIDRRTWSHI
jgi:hypothetical protein